MPQVFRGRTMQEAQRAASVALGRDAVILTSRKVRRVGMAGLFGAAEFEVAAVPPAPATAIEAPRGSKLFAAAAYKNDEPEARTPTSDVAKLRNELRGEIRALKSAIAKPIPNGPDVAAELAALRASVEMLTPAPKKSDRVATLLRARGIEGAVATTLGRILRSNESDASLDECFRDALADLVKVAAWPLATNERCVIALVGSAGVGKTTTAAKLAAHAKMDGRSITLVACDTFRVGAVEQLRRYASLLDAKFETAESGADLARVIAQATTDVVIVDTSGRTPNEAAAEGSLTKAAFSAIDHGGRTRHVLLCLPGALRERDAARAVKTFAVLDPTALVATKLDETDAPTGLLHAPVLAKLPITTLCFGQRVPEDVAPATKGAILDYLAPLAPRSESRATTK
jgi:flagellar biosynthesis protein FlhF